MQVEMNFRLQQGQLAVFTTMDGSGVQLKVPTDIFRELGEPQQLVVGIGGFAEDAESAGSGGVEYYFSAPIEIGDSETVAADSEDGDGASADVVAESGEEAAGSEEE